MSHNTTINKIFTPTISSALKTLNSSTLGQPSHIIIHTGTNDLEKLTFTNCCENFQQLIKLAAEKFTSSKIIISSMVKRLDDKDQARTEINEKLGNICSPYPNIHLVSNENITEDCLYDNKHIKQRRIGILVANIKDVMFNRVKRPNSTPTYPQSIHRQRTTHQMYVHPTSFSTNANFKNKINTSHQIMPPGFPRQQQLQHYPGYLTSPNRNPITNYYDEQNPSYASIAKTPKTDEQRPPPNTSSLNADTVLNLLKLYEQMRQP